MAKTLAGKTIIDGRGKAIPDELFDDDPETKGMDEADLISKEELEATIERLGLVK